MKILKNVHVGSRTYLSPNEVVMIKAETNYSLIYMRDGSKILVSTTLKIIEERFKLENSFERVHRSFLVNLNHMKAVKNGQIFLENNLICLISRRKLKVIDFDYFAQENLNKLLIINI